MEQRPSPSSDAARLWRELPSPLRLVLDTNVWLDVRRVLGWDVQGRLGPVTRSSLEQPAVAVIRAESAIGRTVRIVVDDVVRGELYDKLRAGHDEWQGCADPRDAARLLAELVSIAVPPVEHELSQPEAHLPDPPLSQRERHDRQIWAQTSRVDGVLVTSDRDLLEAIWAATGSVDRAMRPSELIELAKSPPQPKNS